jgi:aspartate carbamoyltransferase
MPKSSFYQQSYVSIDQITSKKQIDELFAEADAMRQIVEAGEVYEPLRGKMVAILFYQPSTRTFSSFSAAARRLGAYVVAIHGMEQYSSVSKGETLEDTIRSIYQTTGADAIVMRHPDDSSAEVAAGVSPVPIINGGSGKKEHPTQALLDLYTIYNYMGKLDGLSVTMVGDLLYGRTIKSLAKLLALTGKKNVLNFVSPYELKAPAALVKELTQKVTVKEGDNLRDVLKKTDVLYMTRVQKEWFEAAGKLDEYERLKLRFILTRHMATEMKKDAIIMHPLPRVGEIMQEVDEDQRAKYFEQMRSGLYTRMALLKLILEG